MMNPRMAAGKRNLIKFFQWFNGSNLAEQQQDQKYDQNHPNQPHAGMAVAVAIAPDAAGKAAQKDDDQDDDEYRPKRHDAFPEVSRAFPKTLLQPGSKHIPGRES